MLQTPKTIVISAADRVYAPLVNDLFSSLKALKFQAHFDLGLIDVGLGDDANRKHFVDMGIQVVPAKVDIDYPSRTEWEAKIPGLRTLTATPFLRSYFPGYDVYVWMDADMWAQTPEALDTMIAGATGSQAIFIAQELDRCYNDFYTNSGVWQKFSGWYHAGFPPDVAAAMMLKPMLNVGIYAMSNDSPVWDAWADIYGAALQRVGALREETFMAHQLAMNIALYLHGKPCAIMPASYNWLTYFALPMIDPITGMYVETLPPYRPISIMHLTRANKLAVEKIQCLDGAIVERQLMFSKRGVTPTLP
jgi:hypothetical protein